VFDFSITEWEDLLGLATFGIVGALVGLVIEEFFSFPSDGSARPPNGLAGAVVAGTSFVINGCGRPYLVSDVAELRAESRHLGRRRWIVERQPIKNDDRHLYGLMM
jgi:hypothetical protein